MNSEGIRFQVKPNESMHSLKCKYSSILGFKPDQVKLMFKNHYVEGIETPNSLGISNGDCVKIFF